MATRELVDSSAVGTVTPLRPALPDDRIREAAWTARCIGRIDEILGSDVDLAVLAPYLDRRNLGWGVPLFSMDGRANGVWIVRDGMVELFVGLGQPRQIVGVLGPGDVDGDVPLVLGNRFAYSARAVTDVQALYLSADAFYRLLDDSSSLARRWLVSIATRVAKSERRLTGLLGKNLTVQVARLLLDESIRGEVHLPQRTLAAMLGVQRPSLNKVLKELEKRGLLEVGYSRISVRDRVGLESIAS